MGGLQISVIPPLLSTITKGGGGLPEFFFDSSVSQLSALAIHRPIWGASLNAPLSYLCHKLGSAIFLMTLACLDISTKKRCL